jgi:hypothetical protein
MSKRGWVTSARQRVVILTFPTVEEAEAWDDAGRPVPAPAGAEIDHVEVEP